MPKRLRAQVYAIPADRSFADALVAGILAKHSHADPLQIARTTVLLPNQRAIRAVSDAFVRASGGALLLPRLVPVGDSDLGEAIGLALENVATIAELPSSVPPYLRRAILTRLVQEERLRAGAPVSTAEAMRLATELARTADELLYEEVDLSQLAEIAPPDLSQHWERSLTLLRIILDRWPEERARLGVIDGADRRNRLLRGVAELWERQPSDNPVYAAGINVTAPAVVALLKTIAFMPGGAVVLADVDTDMMDDEAWDAVKLGGADPETGLFHRGEETHPQYALKLLLHRMGIARSEVQPWKWTSDFDSSTSRRRLISDAMLPARLTARWGETGRRKAPFDAVTVIEAAHPEEEATAIAIALREVLETPGRTAALVTADRLLATRVSAQLQRWGISADDSAGRPLAQLPAGSLLIALAEAWANGFAPVELLTLLKHPLVTNGMDRIAWLGEVRSLDLLLRGPRPPGGLDCVTSTVKAAGSPILEAWWAEVLTVIQRFRDRPDTDMSLRGAIDELASVAGQLSAERIWAGSEGKAASQLISDITASFPPDLLISVQQLPSMLTDLLGEVAIRPPHGGHPRLAIFGLLEARLQKRDLMIVGGLNEGNWPPIPKSDPWLAPRIRRELGLSSLERRIGLSAHDLANCLGAPRVILSRAQRDERQPTIPSRFWMRLQALTGSAWTRDDRLLTLARSLDRPAIVQPAERPAPAPPASVRPLRVAVTQVDRLAADPYTFYAAHILHLNALKSVDSDPDAAWRGSHVHQILETWWRDDGGALDKLMDRADRMLSSRDMHVFVRSLWRPRVLESLQSFQAMIARDQDGNRIQLLAEEWGETTIAGVTIYGKADRIDQDSDGRLVIVDYKSGKPPSIKEVRAGYAQQLGLLALISARGGFKSKLSTTEFGGAEYWSLARSREKTGYRQPITDPQAKYDRLIPSDLLEVAERNFTDVAAKWLLGTAPFVARPHPDAKVFADYDQVMRLQEWDGLAIPGDGREEPA